MAFFEAFAAYTSAIWDMFVVGIGVTLAASAASLIMASVIDVITRDR